MSAHLVARALVVGVACLASACRGSSSQGSSLSSELRDETPRVISLHDVTTEIVVALGAADRLVGMDELTDASDELRAATARVPRVEGLETLLAVRPDLVVGLEMVNRKSPDLVRALEQHGKAVHLPSLTTVKDVEALVTDVARCLHREKEGAKILADLEARLGPIAAPESQKKRVFVYDCCDPPFTAGRRTVLSDVIERVGGHNVFADVDAAFTHVSWEEALARKPELVVVHAYAERGSTDVDAKGVNAKDVNAKIAALKAMPALRAVPTVVLPLRYSLGGLQTGEAAKALRAALEGRGPT